MEHTGYNKRNYDGYYYRRNSDGEMPGRNNRRGFYNKEWKEGMEGKDGKVYKEDKGFYYNNYIKGSGGDRNYRKYSRSRSKSKSRSVSYSDSKSYHSNNKNMMKNTSHVSGYECNLSNYKYNDKTNERNKYKEFKPKRNNSYYYHNNNTHSNLNDNNTNTYNNKQRDNDYYHKNRNRNYMYNNSNNNNNNSQNIKKEITRNISNTKIETHETEKEKEPSNTLLITDLNPGIHQELLLDIFREKCLDFKTSMPDDIRIIEELKIAYIIFPSISTCMTIYEALQGKIFINGTLYHLSYTPNLQQTSNKESITYVTHLTDSNLFTTSMETIVHEDWFCEYCDWKNFSRRVQCFKCKRPKTLNCRIAPVIKQKTTITGEGGIIPPSPSLMIRGPSLKDSNEAELLEVFGKYGPIKDIRMVKDHISQNEFRDYAFVEYFTVENATFALDEMKRNPLDIRGEPIYAAYSKIKRDDCLWGFPLSQVGSGSFANLTNEEKAKFDTIAQLQNICERTKQEGQVVGKVGTNENKNEKGDNTNNGMNIRRERTQREKIEMEMKKWSKRVENQKGVICGKNITVENQQHIIPDVIEKINSVDNNDVCYDNYDVVKLDEYKKDNVKQENVISNKQNDFINETNHNEQTPQTFICYICQRKFPNAEKLKLHETMSELHKANLEKQKQQTLS